MNKGLELDWSFAISALPVLLKGIQYTIFIADCSSAF
jgi:hypothetical protein